MDQTQEYLALLKEIAFDAGKIASDFLNNSHPTYKSDRSIITDADKAVSKLVHERLKDVLRQPEHILIEEEDPHLEKNFNQKTLDQKRYIWAIDPIDGSRTYANRMPLFGISLGLIRDLKPWLSVVYFPILKEMFYADGQGAFFVQNAFTENEKKTPITPIDQEIVGYSIFFVHDTFFKRNTWDFSECHVQIQSCAVVELCWPSIGRGCGTILRSSLWDFAGSWPIYQAAGLELRNFESGKVLSKLDMSLFATDRTPWKLKDFYLLSSERNYPIIKSKITPISHD